MYEKVEQKNEQLIYKDLSKKMSNLFYCKKIKRNRRYFFFYLSSCSIFSSAAAISIDS